LCEPDVRKGVQGRKGQQEEEQVNQEQQGLSPRTRATLRTLMLLPDDVVLDMAGRELDMYSGNRCLCGWALREVLAKAADLPPERFNVWEHTGNVPVALASQVGGTTAEWSEIFNDVMDSEKVKEIELAFVLRLELAMDGVPA
jgi:hypothetical protein